jgi:hypothetical protein
LLLCGVCCVRSVFFLTIKKLSIIRLKTIGME